LAVTAEVASSSLVVPAILSNGFSAVTPKTPTHNPPVFLTVWSGCFHRVEISFPSGPSSIVNWSTDDLAFPELLWSLGPWKTKHFQNWEDHVSVLVKVTNTSKEDVYINPEQIVWIKQHHSGGTEIRFTNEHATLMLGKKPDELTTLLRDCGK
jgi:hypothetical protein